MTQTQTAHAQQGTRQSPLEHGPRRPVVKAACTDPCARARVRMSATYLRAWSHPRGLGEQPWPAMQDSVGDVLRLADPASTQPRPGVLTGLLLKVHEAALPAYAGAPLV
jgi:hypothetical protein